MAKTFQKARTNVRVRDVWSLHVDDNKTPATPRIGHPFLNKTVDEVSLWTHDTTTTRGPY
jgi:hypothetical protein